MQHNINKPPLTSDPAPCLLILSLEQGKQNLWWGTEGHWTKCVSSSRSWHRVHLSVVVLGTVPGAPLLAPPTGLAPVSPALPVGVPVPSPPDDTPLPLLLSLDVTVVELTWRLPDDRRELVDPAEREQTQLDSKLQSPDSNIYTHTHRSIWIGTKQYESVYISFQQHHIQIIKNQLILQNVGCFLIFFQLLISGLNNITYRW